MLVFVEAAREHERAFSLSELSEDRDAVVIGEEEEAVKRGVSKMSEREYRRDRCNYCRCSRRSIKRRVS